MHRYRYRTKQPKSSKNKALFHLYCPTTKMYLSRSSVRNQHEYDWRTKGALKPHLIFDEKPSTALRIDVAKQAWMEYEFRRLEDDTMPKIEIVEISKIITYEVANVVKAELSDADIITKYLGKTLGEAMAGIPEGFKPVTAVKRKGKTSGICKNLSDAVAEKGVFTFFADDGDATLAKITLGERYVREYDIAGTLEKFRNK